MSRQRQSTAGGAAVAAPTSERRPIADLPPYEAPSAPLNPAAQRALATLQRDHSLRKLNEHLAISVTTLTEMAAAINDTLKAKQALQKRRKAKRAAQGTQNDHDGEEDRIRDKEVDDLKKKVEGMTQRMEESVRKTIDGQAYVEGLNDALKNRQAGAAVQVAGTQTQQSQRRRAGNATNSDENIPDFDPTDPEARSSNATQQPPGPSASFLSAVETHKDRYQSLSLKDRYGQNNAYIGFKRTLHDAQHGEDGPPLGHYTTWFPASKGEPGLGVTASHSNDAEEDDDDIAIAREKMSTKCPLTLKEFREPLTSRKCPHSFEKDAILEMIEKSGDRIGGGGRRGAGEKAVRCPVGGCQMMLTKDDLHTDPLLLRKIRRIQNTRKHQRLDTSPYGSDAEDAGPRTQHNPESIASDSGDDGADVDDVLGDTSRRKTTRTTNVKGEKARSSGVDRTRVMDSARPVSRQIAVSSGAVVMDLEGDDEGDDGSEG